MRRDCAFPSASLLLPGLLAVTALAACGPPYSRTVPRELVARLSYESRIELLEAENDLALAVDKLDEARNEVLRTRAALRRARDRNHAAHREAGQARDELSREVARLAIHEAEARAEYLRARQDVNVKVEELEELGLRCAFARFQVARLGVARKAKVEGSERLRPEEFDAQVKACEEDVARRKKGLAERIQRADKLKAAWEEKKGALAKKTFDARASPYVE